MPVDIFPYIDIPIVSVLWAYSGLSPEEMEKRVVTGFERSLTSNVNDIEHIESQSYNGYAVVRIYFHPNVKIDMAVAQVTATMQTALRQMPPGMFPANVLKYDAASVPILQLGLSSKTLREQEIFDLGNNFIRTPLGTVQGASVSYPFGGKQRAVMVDLNLDELYAKQLSPIDVSNALNLQNLILPAGTAKLAETEYQIRVNSSPVAAERIEQPAHQDGERRDRLHQGRGAGARRLLGPEQHRPHQRIARRADDHHPEREGLHAGHRRCRQGGPSPDSRHVPPELKVDALADQSIFVRASIQGVVREALIAAGLTGLMILLFLGSWRSTLIVCISIPLSILTSLCLLSLLGQTINVMTLGGLALAVGILVDDATVEIENTHRNIAHAEAADPRGARWRVADRRSDLCRHAFDLHRVRAGVAAHRNRAVSVYAAGHGGGLRHARFLPAVPHAGPDDGGFSSEVGGGTVPAWDSRRDVRRQGSDLARPLFVQRRCSRALRYRYVGLLDWSLRAPRAGPDGVHVHSRLRSLGLVWLVGEDFFPNVDSGQMRLHVRAPAGTRIEETEVRFSAIDRDIRNVIPSDEIDIPDRQHRNPEQLDQHRPGRHSNHLQRRR